MKTYILYITLFLSILGSCKKDDVPAEIPVPLSDENLISSFQINISGELINGSIDQQNGLITVETEDADLNSIVPVIEYSDKARISPKINISQNFNNEVVYTIFAENGDSKVYRVVVINSSSEKQVLGFQLQINGAIYEGDIDNDAATIYVETDQRLESADAVIFVSEGATVTTVNEGPVNFYLPVEYIITAENGTTKIFTLTSKAFEFYDNYGKKYYSNARAVIGGTGLDISIPNSSVVLENDTNSYVLNTEDLNMSTGSDGRNFTAFYYTFPEDMVTATNYKIKYKIGDEVKTESNFLMDVVADDLPIITSSNQTVYQRDDTLILSGTNLVPGLWIYAWNGLVYGYGDNYITVNNEKTELTLPLTRTSDMFPSSGGQSENYSTIIAIYYQNRLGGSYTVEFD
ncbi:MAG: hypothetical protein Mars2KO_41580 [Maribacter sp.]